MVELPNRTCRQVTIYAMLFTKSERKFLGTTLTVINFSIVHTNANIIIIVQYIQLLIDVMLGI